MLVQSYPSVDIGRIPESCISGRLDDGPSTFRASFSASGEVFFDCAECPVFWLVVGSADIRNSMSRELKKDAFVSNGWVYQAVRCAYDIPRDALRGRVAGAADGTSFSGEMRLSAHGRWLMFLRHSGAPEFEMQVCC